MSGIARYAVSRSLNNDFVGMVPQQIGAWVCYEDHRSLLLDARAEIERLRSWAEGPNGVKWYIQQERIALERAERAEALAAELESVMEMLDYSVQLLDRMKLDADTGDDPSVYRAASELIARHYLLYGD